MTIYFEVLIGLLAFIVGAAVSYWLKSKSVTRRIKVADEEAQRIIADAERRSETLAKEAKLEAKDRLFKMKNDFDLETRETRADLKKRERRLIEKEEHLDRKTEKFEQRDREYVNRDKNLKNRQTEIESKEAKGRRYSFT